jgi:hydroxymethylbilane synthase
VVSVEYAMTDRSRLRIGTRGSPLARAQTDIVRARLVAANRLDPASIEVVTISTSGDAVRDRPLAEAGGKGLFTKEIEEALLSKEIDLAVHSAKDVPTFLPHGLVLAAFPERADPRDAFVSKNFERIKDLPAGAVVGSASVRREALLRRLRPDVVVKLLRGNVNTRLEKVANGAFDAAVLALAGLERLGLSARAKEVLDPEIFPPSVGQGAIAIEIRAGDAEVARLAAAIDDAPTATALAAERAFLAELDGSCRTPIAGHARIVKGRLRFHGLVISPDGREAVETAREGQPADAARLGADAGRELKSRAPAGVLATFA